MAKEEFGVEVRVDGRQLPMLPFVRQIVYGTIMGLISQLKGTEDAREMKIRLRRRDDV